MNTTTKKQIEKKTSHAFGKDVFLLGQDADGINYWLEAAKFDCGWYWGFGYVETYRGNRNPATARDIDSHTHIDSSFMGKVDGTKEYIHNIFDHPTFVATTFSEKEGWTLSELFKTFYILKETAEMLHRGGAHLTENPLKHILKNEVEENRINTELLPAVFMEIYKILSPTA